MALKVAQIHLEKAIESRPQPLTEPERAHLLGFVPSGLQQREIAAQAHRRGLLDRELKLQPRLPPTGQQQRQTTHDDQRHE